MKTLLLALLPSLVFAQGVPIKSGNSPNVAVVDSNNNLQVSAGKYSKATYIAQVAGQATTAAITLSIEAEVSRGFRMTQVCYSTGPATAAALVTVSVQRRTTASSAGTVVAAEATTNSVSKLNPADANWSGVVRLGGTPGAAGPMLFQTGQVVGEIGAGTADAPGPNPVCIPFGLFGLGQEPVVLAGVANGLSINITAAGVGGLAVGAISVTFIAE